MGFITNLKRRISWTDGPPDGVERPKCPGCGRPVTNHNEACSKCTSAVERDHGG